jgi:hypothetical protein
LMGNWLPGLEVSRPDIFALLDKEQYYNSNDWLLGLVDVTNETKHVRLSLQSRADCEAVVIKRHGIPVMQIGERDFKEIHIQAPQQNLWVRFGSGRWPRLCKRASFATFAVRKPYDLLVTSFTLLFSPSTAPAET